MANTVSVKYDENTLKTTISVNGKSFDTSRIIDREIADWAYPFSIRKIKWNGFYDEMVAVLNGQKDFQVNFEGSESALSELKESVEGMPVTFASSANNNVVIIYDEKSLKTEITINGKSFDTSRIQGKEIADWVYPFMMRKIKWDGIFTELSNAMGSDEYSIVFSGSSAAMNELIEECPEKVTIVKKKNNSDVNEKKKTDEVNKSNSDSSVEKTSDSIEKEIFDVLSIISSYFPCADFTDFTQIFGDTSGYGENFVDTKSANNNIDSCCDEIERYIIANKSEIACVLVVDLLNDYEWFENKNLQEINFIANRIKKLDTFFQKESPVRFLFAYMLLKVLDYSCDSQYYDESDLPKVISEILRSIDCNVKYDYTFIFDAFKSVCIKMDEHALDDIRKEDLEIDKDLHDFLIEEIETNVAWDYIYENDYDAAYDYLKKYKYSFVNWGGFGYTIKSDIFKKYIDEKDYDNLFKWRLLYIEQYNPDVADDFEIANLGWHYHFGFGTEKDFQLAVKYYKQAYAHGNDYARERLIDLKVDPDSPNYTPADIPELKQACNTLFEPFISEDEEMIAAFEIAMKHAKNGNDTAQYLVGYCYLTGNGTEEDESKALAWFDKSAENGCPLAQKLMGEEYIAGDSLNQNYSRAFELLNKAYNSGNLDAAYSLASCYMYGYGCVKNIATAIEYWKIAADMGDESSMLELGYIYSCDELGFTDYAQASWYTLNAALKDNRVANYRMAQMFAEGIGTDVSLSLAHEHAQKSSDLGCADGTAYLADLYLNGEGVDTDERYAFQLYNRALEQITDGNDTDSDIGYIYFKLGVCYYDGLGVVKDENKGLDYMRKASEEGCENALEFFETINSYDEYKENYRHKLEAADTLLDVASAIPGISEVAGAIKIGKKIGEGINVFLWGRK